MVLPIENNQAKRRYKLFAVRAVWDYFRNFKVAASPGLNIIIVDVQLSNVFI